MTKHLSPEARRRQFLDAAGRLFVRDGLSGVTMIAVAEEAGVSRRLQYDHFADLGTLLRDYVWDSLARQISLSAAQPRNAGAAPPDAVRQVFEEVLRLDPEQRALVEMLRSRAPNPDLALVWETVERNLLVRWRGFEQFRDLPDAQVLVIARVMLGTILELTDAVTSGAVDHDGALSAAVAVGTALSGTLRQGQDSL